ncbi:4725_t:CDS:2 [Funneliformis mosseae]|uniref:4725_t:CDS:1 n=1 Tax=Funneliformis mosseae TaxID=27381 RepID=A0A9N9AA89_FUNMO|nr:4725_t:CDS:2 [Funneliformis mosseae]
MGEKRPISKDALFDIFKNQNEAALRSPTPSHLLNRSGNSAFRTPSLGSTPVNYNLSLHQRAEQLLFLNKLNFNSFQPNSPSTTGNSHEKMENQLKSPIRPLPVRGSSPQLHYALGSFSNGINANRLIFVDDTPTSRVENLNNDNNDSTCQDEEVKMVSFNDRDFKQTNYPQNFDKGKQIIRESQSDQIEHAPENGNYLELIKWHLKVVSINDIFVPEVSERINLWVVLSGIIKGTRNKWHSAVVIARENNKLIQTAKDKSYTLIGKLSAKKMKADAFEDGFPEDWRELLLAELEPSVQGEKIGPLSNEQETEFNVDSNISNLKDGLETESNFDSSLKNEQDTELNVDLSLNLLKHEQRTELNVDSSPSPIKNEQKIETNLDLSVDSLGDGETVTFSGRRIRAPGNWWEINSETKVKEEKVESKKRKLSSVGKRTSSSSIGKHTPSFTNMKRNSSPNSAKRRKRSLFYRRPRKRRPLQKDNITENMRKASHEDIANEKEINETNTEVTMVDVPRHEVYVLVETSR